MTGPESDKRVLGDLLARERRSNRPALRCDDRELDYRRFVTTSWKAGNYLRHVGARGGSTVGVVGRAPPAVLSLFGAVALGATVRVAPTPTAGVDVLVAPTEGIDRFDEPAHSARVGYGSKPDEPAVSYFERDVWSENPVEPPERVASDEPALRFGNKTWTHADVLAVARTAASDVSESDTVAVRAPLAEPAVIAAGFVAPLLVGACVLLPAGDETGTVAVADGDAPEDRTIQPT